VAVGPGLSDHAGRRTVAREGTRLANADSRTVMNVNVDPQELEKFSQLAHRWWDPNSEFKPLHEINPLRLSWIDQSAGLRGKRVLDVGCGGGILAEAMSVLGAEVT